MTQIKTLPSLFFALFLCLTAITVSTPAYANKKYASIVVDADTGIVLHERHADKKLHPASLTKIMTLLMAFEAIEQGKMNLNTRIGVSSHAANMVPSKLGLRAGSSIKLKHAIYALVTKSANDVAVALAEHIGGSEKNFGRLMTRRANQLGMHNTVFRNASGLHDKRQVSTARDMAMLAQYVISAYPQYYRYFSTKNFSYQGKNYHNHNRLLGSYKGMDGMKTGYIQAAGFNLVASAVRNNRRIIGVVFGGRSGKTRNAHMASLLDGGFSKINKMRIAKARVPMPARKPGIAAAVEKLPQLAQAANNQIAAMGALIGEGDFDGARIKRIETGMIAMAAHTGKDIKGQDLRLLTKPATPHANTIQNVSNGWSIQLGAYKSRAATDQILMSGLQKLPPAFGHAQRVIAPLKTAEGWLFRGRLSGLSQSEALSACKYFQSCMPIAPGNQ
ncbi:MAG: D-alanyl-D-alanine carboxypeptidase family protein [Alphaproteobacteria bacterium]